MENEFDWQGQLLTDQHFWTVHRNDVYRAEVTRYKNVYDAPYRVRFADGSVTLIDSSKDTAAMQAEVEAMITEKDQALAQAKGTLRTFPTRTYHIMDAGEFDAIVQSEYKRPDFFCVEVYEWEGLTHSFTADELKREDDADDQIAAFIAGDEEDFPPAAETLLGDLIHRCIIPEGNYLINISW